MKPAQRTFAVLVAGSIANAVSGFYAGGLGGRVVDGRRAFVVANEKENSPFAALINAAKAAADSAKAAADSLVPIDDTPLDDEYNSSPERLARLTEQQRIAERKREERQDALFKQPPSSPPPLKSPLEKIVQAFTPVEVDRNGNPVVEPPPSPPVADDRDVGEKLFSFFFGAPDEGVVSGIARTSSAPDTYPATKTEFAEAVAGDDAEMALLRPLLKNTNLEFLDLKLVYDAQRDGWTAGAFHNGANYMGPCLVVCKVRSGAVCGGYAPKGFAGYGEYRGSIAAFLFSWPDGDTSQPVVKLQKIGGAGLATIDEPETGPRFGSDGLVMMMNPGTERIVTSKLGPYYELMPDGSRSVFSRKPGSDEMSELRVYSGCWPEGERIPFDGAIPFAIE